MNIRSISLSQLAIPLRVEFKHAQAVRSVTDSLWVNATTDTGLIGNGEACPRSYVTGESPESAQAFFREHAASVIAEVHDLGGLAAWADAHREKINRNPAAWCAIELALLDAIAQHENRSISTLLALEATSTLPPYSAVVGDSDHGTFVATVERYRDLGMTDFKIKLSGDAQRDEKKLQTLRSLCGEGIRIRADGNNVYPDATSAITALRRLRDFLWAIEEPVQARDLSAMRRIHDALKLRMILDESVCSRDDVTALEQDPERWIINLRVSKMGGLLRSLELACRAHGRKIDLIVGAQVGETSLLTRAGMLAASAFPSAVVAREGAFGTFLLKEDVCSPSLMFGKLGLVAGIQFSTTGWQLDIQPNADHLRLVEST